MSVITVVSLTFIWTWFITVNILELKYSNLGVKKLFKMSKNSKIPHFAKNGSILTFVVRIFDTHFWPEIHHFRLKIANFDKKIGHFSRFQNSNVDYWPKIHFFSNKKVGWVQFGHICTILISNRQILAENVKFRLRKPIFGRNLEFWITANILIGLFLPKIESDNGYSCVISRHISSSGHFVNSRESTKCDRPIF